MKSDLIRVVIDTNVIVSAALKPGSVPSLIVSAGIDRKIEICITQEIKTEYNEVLRRGKFSFPLAAVKRFLNGLERSAKLMKETKSISICADKDDDKFIECSEASDALYLITGNKKHFPSTYGRVKVVTPREFALILISAGIF